MKIAIGGKGGVGKTTLTALLAHLFAQDKPVSVVDADPSLNLAQALGIPPEQASRITPLSEMKELIQERVGSRGGFFKLNPKVDDLADKISITHHNLRLIVMGTITKGGAGCACADNVLLRAFLTHLLLDKSEVVLVDLEAGIEHLGRRTIQAVEALLVVVEPGWRSIQVAQRIIELAGHIGLKRVLIVGNKVAEAEDSQLICGSFPPEQILGLIPFSPEILRADKKGLSPLEHLPPQVAQELALIKSRLNQQLA